MAWITVKKDFDFYPAPRSCLAFKASDVPVSTTQAAANYGVKIGAAEHFETPTKDGSKEIKSKATAASKLRSILNG